MIRGLGTRCLGRVLLAFVVVTGAESSFAHTPHHTIDALEVLATADNSNVYIVRGGWQLFVSSDQGLSWRELSRGLTSRYQYTALSGFSEEDGSQHLFIGTDGDGVFRSTDAGLSWEAVNQGLTERRIRRLLTADDLTDEPQTYAFTQSGRLLRFDARKSGWTECATPDEQISAVAVINGAGLTNDPQLVMATSSGQVWSAPYGCTNWVKLAEVSGAPKISSLSSGPENQKGVRPLLIGTQEGDLYAFEENQAVMPLVGFPAGAGAIQSIFLLADKDGGEEILVTGWDQAVYRSADNGQSWSHLKDGLSTHPQANSPAFLAPQFRNIKVADGYLFLAGFDGLFRSLDNGRTWQQMVTEPPGNIWSLSVSPQLESGHAVALTTFDAGAYLSMSADYVWQAINRGHGIRRLRPLVFSPDYQNDQRLFTTQDEGDFFLRSENRGASWSVQQFDRGWYIRNKIRLLATLHHRIGLPESMTLDLISKDERLAANPKGLVLSPDFARDQRVFVSTRYRGNYESTDAGQNLHQMDFDSAPLWEMIISPSFEVDGTIFGSSREQGVFRSIDLGASWQPINRGLTFLDEWKDALTEGRALVELGQSMFYDIKLAISPNYADDGTVFLGTGPGFFRSTDRGSHWLESQDLKGGYVLALAVSPAFADDQTLLVSLKGLGLWKSVDAGRSFSSFGSALLAHNHEIRQLVFSPEYADDGKIYAASQEYVFFSADRGHSWTEIDRPVRYETNSRSMEMTGDWQRVESDRYSGGSAHRLADGTGRLKFRFLGTGVSWIGSGFGSTQSAEVYLDGSPWLMKTDALTVQQHSEQRMTIANLPFKEHTLTIEIGESTTDDEVIIDAVDVLNSRRPAFEGD